MTVRRQRDIFVATKEGEKNAMALKEINSNEEPIAGGRQLLMLLPNDTPPL